MRIKWIVSQVLQSDPSHPLASVYLGYMIQKEEPKSRKAIQLLDVGIKSNAPGTQVRKKDVQVWCKGVSVGMQFAPFPNLASLFTSLLAPPILNFCLLLLLLDWAFLLCFGRCLSPHWSAKRRRFDLRWWRQIPSLPRQISKASLQRTLRQIENVVDWGRIRRFRPGKGYENLFQWCLVSFRFKKSFPRMIKLCGWIILLPNCYQRYFVGH